MNTRVRILCINKYDRNNPYERILAVGGEYLDGSKWRLSLEDAIKKIEEESLSFFVSVDNNEVDVIVAISPHGNKYLKTEADGDEPNNLLNLPECL
jgi:hypothetical protein